jgi:hypothetical protein
MTPGRAALVTTVTAVVVAAIALVILLGRSATTVTSDGVEVECAVTDEATCATWADSVLADGPGIQTFDPDDLERVRVARSVLGLFGECQAEYFLGRYDDAAARESVPCPGDRAQ